MIIKYNETAEDRINAVKSFNKTSIIIKIVLKILLFIIACYLFFGFNEKFFSFLFVFAIILITILDIIKKNRNYKVIREKFNYNYNDVVSLTITFHEDKLTIFNEKNNNTFTLTYEKIKRVKITKKYIFIISAFKEYIFLKRTNLTIEQYNSIINIFQEQNIIKK